MSFTISPHVQTLVELLRLRAQSQPEQQAYTFLVDGETEGPTLTYQALDAQARAIGAWLQGTVAPGDRALLLYRPGLEFIAAFFGCLYAGVIAVPSYTPKINRRDARLHAILQDAQAAVALTDTATFVNYERFVKHTEELGTLAWQATGELDLGLADRWQAPVSGIVSGSAPDIDADTLAFLQYTSGSTGSPKGVMVSHGNLLSNLTDIDRGFKHTPESVMVTWLPTFHDLGLIYGVLQPIYNGFPCYIMAPVSFIQQPIRWLQAISRYRGTHSAAPNFAYALCMRQTTPEQRSSLDLSSWKVATNAAEPVREETIIQFNEMFKPYGFQPHAICPCYGLAEATLKVAGGRIKEEPVFCTVEAASLAQDRIVIARDRTSDTRTLVGCGWTEIDSEIVIVHPDRLTRCESDEVGEIWVSGSTVTQGYWQQTEETAQTFHAFVVDTGEGPFLRTGDMGFVHEGNLFITGRLKDLIIIRGRNHYPQDIEFTVQKSHPALEADATAAFSVDVDGEERLIVAQEVMRTHRRNLDADDVFETIRQAVIAEHEVQIHAVLLLQPASILKTSSGKIQRRACRAGYLDGTLKVLERHVWETADLFDEIPELKTSLNQNLDERQLLLESQLKLAVSKLLGVDSSKLNWQLPLGSMGFDSLKTAELTNYIFHQLGAEIPLEYLLQNPTITQLATQLQAMMHSPSASASTLPASSAPDAAVPIRSLSDYSPLVPIQPDGTKPPFFCVHPWAGMAYPYFELAQALGTEQPFYGFQAAGIYGEGPDTTIEEMSRRYLERMRAYRPEGPYLIGGWSLGGLVAYEMARQLHEMGEETALLAIFDMPAMNHRYTDNLFMARFPFMYMLPHLWPHVYDYFKFVAQNETVGHSNGNSNGGAQNSNKLWLNSINPLKLSVWLSGTMPTALLETVRREVYSLTTADSTARRMFHVINVNIAAMLRYRPQSYAGRVTLFRTRGPIIAGLHDPALGWSHLAACKVEMVPGHHLNLLKKPHVQQLATQLDMCINSISA